MKVTEEEEEEEEERAGVVKRGETFFSSLFFWETSVIEIETLSLSFSVPGMQKTHECKDNRAFLRFFSRNRCGVGKIGDLQFWEMLLMYLHVVGAPNQTPIHANFVTFVNPAKLLV